MKRATRGLIRQSDYQGKMRIGKQVNIQTILRLDRIQETHQNIAKTKQLRIKNK